jgi:drug/metabolite transporter (DMT)-like permease
VSDPDPETDDDPDESRRRRWKLALAFAAIYVIWGSTYLAIRVGVRSLPPFAMSGSRFICAGGILYALLRARGATAPTRRQWANAAVAGLLMLTAGNGLVTWAEQQVPSNLTALLVAAVPLYVAVLDWLRPGGTPPTRRVLVGIALGACGMALLVSGGKASAHGATALGVGAILVSGLCWAAGSLYSRYGGMHGNPVMAAAQQMLAGGVAMWIVSLSRGELARLSPAAFTPASTLAFVYLTLMGSLVAFSAYGWLVKESTPARLSTTAYVNPVVAVILGRVFLDERLGGRALAGALLILGAVAVMTLGRPGRRPRATRPPAR